MNFVVTRIYQCRACSADRPDFNLYIMCTQYLQEREREREKRGHNESYGKCKCERWIDHKGGLKLQPFYLLLPNIYKIVRAERNVEMGGGWVFDVCKSILFCHSLDHTAHKPQSASKFLLNIPILQGEKGLFYCMRTNNQNTGYYSIRKSRIGREAGLYYLFFIFTYEVSI